MQAVYMAIKVLPDTNICFERHKTKSYNIKDARLNYYNIWANSYQHTAQVST